MGRVIKLGDKEFTEEEMQEIVRKNEELRLTDQIADSILVAYNKGEGLALQIAIPMAPDDIRQMVEPEHPALPHLVMRVLAEDLRVRVMTHLGMIVELIREKRGEVPSAPQQAEEHDPGQISTGSGTEQDLDAATAAAAAAALAAFANPQAAMQVPAIAEASGALSVQRADGSKD